MSNKIVTSIELAITTDLKIWERLNWWLKLKNRKPMKIFASRISSADDNKSYYTGYENAVFNGECD